MAFSRSSPPKAVKPCKVDPCKEAKAKDDALVARSRQRAKALKAMGDKKVGAHCLKRADEMTAVTTRFEKYEKALPSARAARDLNELGDNATAPVKQPCLKRLPLNAAYLNKELGINPKSPNAIKPADLRNDATGYRSAVYRDERTGRLIVVSRDTQPHSLADWRTNIENGQGGDTDQYKAARKFASKLQSSGQKFDISGYSKGGGLAQEMGLVSPNSNVYVFNSAGLNDASLARTGQRSFNSLSSRSSAFSAQGDFLTDMNNAPNAAAELSNARFLRDQLAGPTGWNNLSAYVRPMQIQYANPANINASDPGYIADRAKFLRDVDAMIAKKEANPNGPRMFPPVRSGSHETIPNSMSNTGSLMGATKPGPSLGKLAQHQISNVVGPDANHPGPMEKQMMADRANMNNFEQTCR
jgi:hypothetical protein